jgi:predicted ThiF/HesA family dinucleotide-utilizing enzyme
MANNKPIGVAYLDQDIIGAQYLLSDEQIGYTAAAQGTVTQATSKSTAVTLNKAAGVITMNNASLATATNATFTLNNSFISANDTIILTIAGGQTTPGSYNVFANALAAGTVSITLRNISGGSLSEAIVVNFAIIHCA